MHKEQSSEEHLLDCLVCAEHCRALGVFNGCGHFVCFGCALRIHSLDKKPCPVCREACTQIYVTRQLPLSEDGFDLSKELTEMKNTRNPEVIRDKKLNCIIDGKELASHVAKLYEFLCPLPQCWAQGEQEPFLQESMLKDHLHYDHGVKHCPVCVKYRPAFLCEQQIYTEREFETHLAGNSKKDAPSFQGHPPCRFCSNERFYDGESLLKHMQHAHFSCDLCNRGEFTFVFYKNRNKLHEHFDRVHKLCDHRDCAHLDPMLRVFPSELELHTHKQRAHGATNRGITPEALGFRFSNEAQQPVPLQQGASGRSAANDAPATGANTHAMHITFDHVSRREVVDTMPKATNSAGEAKKGRHGRGGKQKGEEDEDLPEAHLPHGIPQHYYTSTIMMEPLRQTQSPHHSHHNHNHHHGSRGAPAAKPSWSRAGGVEGASKTCNGTPSSSSDLPVSKEDQMRLFDEKLKLLVRSARTYNEFRYVCGDFLSGKLLASEFYDSLQTVFFPNPADLNDIFPLLVATLPSDVKGEALKQIRQMRTAPELQRALKAQEEDTTQKKTRESLKMIFATKEEKKQAWTYGVSATVKTANPYAPTPSTAVSTAARLSAALEPARPPASWGGKSTPTTVAPLVHSDPEDFPELPVGGASTRRQQNHNKPPVKNNAWFQKAASGK